MSRWRTDVLSAPFGSTQSTVIECWAESAWDLFSRNYGYKQGWRSVVCGQLQSARDMVPSSVSVVATEPMIEVVRIPTCIMPHGRV